MGTRYPVSPLWNPSFTLVLYFIVGIHSVVSACNVRNCWGQFNSARQSMNEKLMNSELTSEEANDLKCITFRTYNNCLKNLSRGCAGELQYQSIKIGLKNQMLQYNCTASGPVHKQDPNRPDVLPIDSPCAYHKRRIHRHCGLFGDPHLRTFNNEFQTCKIRGAWPLVNNEHLTVQVTNDVVNPNGGATATSKLTVVIKKNDDCVKDKFLMYQAQTDYLPGHFYDGHTHHGVDKSVELIERDPGKHVEIFVKYIDTTISVRQIGRYFTFAISMPEEVLNNTKKSDSLELCVRGCPVNEQINYREFLVRQRTKYMELDKVKLAMTREEAVEICKKADVVDFYFESCVFDLMTTGDKNFTLASHNALKDLLRLNPNSGTNPKNPSRKNRTNESETETSYTEMTTFSSSCKITVDSRCWIISLLLTVLIICRGFSS